MEHIFLDTNILFNDPFMKGALFKRLLALRGKKEAKIYISDIVVWELKKHTIENNAKAIKELKKNIAVYNNSISIKMPELKFECSPVADKDIDDFLKEYVRLGYIEIVPSSDVKIDRIMQRYFNKQKPFDENKNSFQDTAIWFSYVDYIKANNLKNCFFISNNTKDFANKEKSNLHADLLRDYSDFTYFDSLEKYLSRNKVKHILRTEIEQNAKAYSKKLGDWLLDNFDIETIPDNQDISEFAFDLFKTKITKSFFQDKCYDKIEQSIYSFCSDKTGDDFDLYDADFIEFEEFDDIDLVELYDFSIMDDATVDIYGSIKVSFFATAYVFNSAHEGDDELYYPMFSGTVNVEFAFYLSLNTIDDVYQLSLDDTEYDGDFPDDLDY